MVIINSVLDHIRSHLVFFILLDFRHVRNSDDSVNISGLISIFLGSNLGKKDGFAGFFEKISVVLLARLILLFYLFYVMDQNSNNCSNIFLGIQKETVHRTQLGGDLLADVEAQADSVFVPPVFVEGGELISNLRQTFNSI